MSSAWEQELLKIHAKIIARKDSEIFREPVAWEAMGLTDYPTIVKTPMDLGTVKSKLESREYKKFDDCIHDIRLVWSNAMLYNFPGSGVYKMAKGLSEFWEGLWAQTPYFKDDVDKPPTPDEVNSFVSDCNSLNADQLGKVLLRLDEICPISMQKRGDVNEVEVNVDLINGKVFRDLRLFMQPFFPDIKRKSKR